MTRKMTAVSLFSGCGGFCEGVELAGFDIKFAVEFDRFACETYRANFPRTPLFEGDIHDFLNGRLKAEHLRQCGSAVDLVFGGPPCQGFSQIGPRDILDERNDLYLQYARVVTELKPRMFLMENVPNILLMEKGHYKDAILKHFSKLGYRNSTYVKVSAADFGVPQTRERVFFFGTRDDVGFDGKLIDLANGLLQKIKVKTPVTVWEAIGDLPSRVVPSGSTMNYPSVRSTSKFLRMMRLDFSEAPYSVQKKRQRAISGELILYNHHTKEMQEKRAHLISFLKPGEKADTLPKHIWNGSRPEKWRRLHPGLPSYTILAQMHRDLSEWVHPKLERWITVREAARLQSFHDGFVFKSSEWQMLKQIGNAVPPLLGYAVASMVRDILKATTTVSHKNTKVVNVIKFPERREVVKTSTKNKNRQLAKSRA